MPTMNREDHRVITFDDEEIKDLFNGDENFAKQLSEEYFYWFDAKFNDKYFMKGITKPDTFDTILLFFEREGDPLSVGIFHVKRVFFRIGELCAVMCAYIL